ncbi:unnamed protein product [Brachionus calyciflorus]|uniref:Uncharacterized protein n=1 Tax=Brachionus calyciflorus TaxID=104777 RepID=A0A813M8K2_9BILA|nr:unnamed protein product [Brachionus calyciflorus]
MKLEPKKKSLRNRLKNSVLEVILSSTSHGIPNIVRSSNMIVKLVWIASTLLSSGLCAYMITQSFLKYFSYDVITKTRYINEFKTIFPSVTVCNLNFFTSENSIKFIKTLNDDIKFFRNPIENDFHNIAKSLRKNFSNSDLIFGDTKEKLIVYCRSNTLECDLDLIDYYNHPEHGACYTFNLREPYAVSFIPKKYFSLRLVLNISVPDENNFISASNGALVIIHNRTISPFQYEGICIPPKTEANIALSRTFYSSIPKPYSNCDGNTNDPNAYDSELYKLIHNNSKTYSQFLCVSLCGQRFIIKMCGCYYPMMLSFFNAKACTIYDDSCYIKYYKTILASDYVNNVCLKECPLECEGMTFQKTISYNHFTNKDWIKYLQSYNKNDSLYFNKTIDPKHLVAVNVYHDSLSYINIEESPTVSFVDLLSSIGGIAGLFMGVSVLSLVEIIEVFIQICLVFKSHVKVHESP